MFSLGYYHNSDPNKTVIVLTGQSYANFETAKRQGRLLQDHPSFFHKTVVVLDRNQGRGYKVY